MRKKIKSKKQSIVVLAVVVIIASLLVVLGLINKIDVIGNKNTTPSLPPASSDSTPPESKIDYSPAKPEDTVVSPEKNLSAPEETPKPTIDSPISVLITRASRQSVGVYIEKLNEGSCSLSVIQNGSEKISMNAKVIPQKDYSTCEGFEIDSTKLNGSTFTVKVTVSSSGRTGSATQEVN